MITVYVPPSANSASAWDVLHTSTSRLQKHHPQVPFLITGNTRNTISTSSEHRQGIQFIASLSPGELRSSNLCSLHTVGRAMSSSMWEELCPPLGENINSIMDCIDFCVDNIVPIRKVWCFSNYKPWIDRGSCSIIYASW